MYADEPDPRRGISAMFVLHSQCARKNDIVLCPREILLYFYKLLTTVTNTTDEKLCHNYDYKLNTRLTQLILYNFRCGKL